MKKLVKLILIVVIIIENLQMGCMGIENVVESSARSSIIVSSKSLRILSGKNIYEQLGIASVTKIMTLIIALENSDLNSVVKVSSNAANTGEASMHLVEGEKITLENLLYGLMLASGNDAAVAVAEHVAGSIEEFVPLMNQKAYQVGAKKTFFVNPNGLTISENIYNKSTAYDLALITSYGFENPKFAEIVSTKTKSIQRENFGYTEFFENHNRFLKMYPGADGVKTGYTKKSGRCLVTSVTKDNLRLVAVTLCDPNDWYDHKCMYDFAFGNYKNEIVAKKDEILGKIKVLNGVEKFVNLVPLQDYYFPVKAEENMKMTVCAEKVISAPIKKDVVIGELKLEILGKECARFPLIAQKEIMLKNTFVEKNESYFKTNFNVLFKTWIFTVK
ncbi:MAG: D-alanyl-D-alanine carboxypeptidase [Clostridiales bacterium]|nr:D-alanyl-D-alanine carboxypeptidase [Clostridiales bacterium]